MIQKELTQMIITGRGSPSCYF